MDTVATKQLWRKRDPKALAEFGIPSEEAHRELAKILCGCANPCSRRYKMKAEPSPICPFCDIGEEETKEEIQKKLWLESCVKGINDLTPSPLGKT